MLLPELPWPGCQSLYGEDLEGTAQDGSVFLVGAFGWVVGPLFKICSRWASRLRQEAGNVFGLRSAVCEVFKWHSATPCSIKMQLCWQDDSRGLKQKDFQEAAPKDICTGFGQPRSPEVTRKNCWNSGMNSFNKSYFFSCSEYWVTHGYLN